MGGLLHSATAGTDESGDVVVTVTPADQTQIILHTALRAQFGEAMKQTVGELLDAQQLTAVAQRPWQLIPGAFVVIAVLMFNFIGDGLRDAADPYSRS